MDGERFDAIVRNIGVPAPRRTALQVIGAGTLAALFAGRGADLAEAAKRPVSCPESGCRVPCRNAVGGQGFPCACVRLLNGDQICVEPFCRNRCRSNRDCGRREVCSTTASNCCSTDGPGVCVRPCKRGNPRPQPMAASGWSAAEL